MGSGRPRRGPPPGVGRGRRLWEALGVSARVLLPVVLLVMASAAGAGVIARDAYKRQTPPPVEQVVDAASGAPTSLAPSEQPGDSKVLLTTDVSKHPDGARVVELLQKHFDSINARNFQDWVTTVTEQRRALTPGESAWRKPYETTRDGTILVHRLEAVGPQRLKAMITFTSTQDPVWGPADLRVGCVRWRVVYPLQVEDGALRVDVGTEGQSSQFEPC